MWHTESMKMGYSRVLVLPATACVFMLGICLAAPAQERIEKFKVPEKKIEKKEKEKEKVPENAKQVSLNVGEVKEVFVSDKKTGTATQAYFIPSEANGTVQLVVETDKGKKTFFLKGLSPGRTLGGVVGSELLDTKYYQPLDDACMARVQKAVKEAPHIITVKAAGK
jgi:hypothetical protein